MSLNSTDCDITGEANHGKCACCFKPDGSECAVCDLHKEWRAKAISEEAALGATASLTVRIAKALALLDEALVVADREGGSSEIEETMKALRGQA